MKICSLILGIFLFFASGLFAQQASKDYKIRKSIPVSGNGSWDYLTFDNLTQRIFISHGDCVQVIELKTGKQAGGTRQGEDA